METALAAIHLLSSAAWFGSLIYRVLFVDPKAARFFEHGADFERFSLDLAHGMRYVVMLALAACGLSGFALAGLRWNTSEPWQTTMLAKVALWLVACVLFAYISWVHWPRRVFADASEWRRVRRQGVALAVVMVGIAATGMVLGQWAADLTPSPPHRGRYWVFPP